MAQSSFVTVVTKPGQEGQGLTQALTDAGFEAAWWPAFEVQLTPEDDARAALDTLDSFDCVIFVSVSAVASVARILGNRVWPASVAAAAVGPVTAAAIWAQLTLPPNACVLAPDGADEQASGSEALWPMLQKRAPKRVLVARAQTGRQWIAHQLGALGADVTYAVVYRRVPVVLGEGHGQALNAWLARGKAVVIVLTSSEAVDIWASELSPERRQALSAGRVVVTHSRIAQRVRDLGLPAPACISAQPGALIAYLQTLKSDTL